VLVSYVFCLRSFFYSCHAGTAGTLLSPIPAAAQLGQLSTGGRFFLVCTAMAGSWLMALVLSDRNM
jgi:hypothetical protein